MFLGAQKWSAYMGLEVCAKNITMNGDMLMALEGGVLSMGATSMLLGFASAINIEGSTGFMATPMRVREFGKTA